jgi:hypothetical protein
MVGVDLNGSDVLVEQDPLLGVGRGFPDLVEIDAPKQFGDLVESLSEVVGPLTWLRIVCQRSELGGDACLLLGEEVGGDLVA